MHLHYNPFAAAFFQHTCPAGIFPIGWTSIPFAAIIKAGRIPGCLSRLRKVYAQVIDFITCGLEGRIQLPVGARVQYAGDGLPDFAGGIRA